MTVPGPVLLLIAPADWDVVPAAVVELRHCLADNYGALLRVLPTSRYASAPVRLYSGPWIAHGDEEVARLVGTAFSSLDWLNLADVE